MVEIKYIDRQEEINGRKAVVREIGDLSRELLDISKLRKITNGRYPSFYTFSHACGGSDNGPGQSLEWFNTKGYGLFEEAINPGICVASPVNNRNFEHIPLFVFGSQNPRFADFLKAKYYRLSQREDLDRCIKDGSFSKKILEIFPEDENAYYKGRAGGLCFDSRVSDVANIEDVSEVYEEVRYRYSQGIEVDYGLLFNCPIWCDDCDGSFVTTDRSLSFNLEGRVKKIEDGKRKPLRWGDAEMMIDLFGLFDGKKKIIFF